MKHFKILNRLFMVMGLMLLFLSCSESENKNKDAEQETIKPVSFTVIGDVPYGDVQRDGLIALVNTHNTITSSEFVVHVGDIKRGADPCNEAVYADVSSILKAFTTPTFMLLGDNEYNDCSDPIEGLSYWKRYFLKFNENWTFDQKITYQVARSENFSWVQEKILFIGLNIVGSSVHDQAEWTERLTDNMNFLNTQIEANKNDIEAIVVMAHANMVEAGAAKFEPFTIPFRAAAASFKKPILFLQGDGHFWFRNKPWDEKNITRVQIDGGTKAVQVTVDARKSEPFSFDRTFLD
tara:strand:+ start:74156 stop:75037 length:882 start_codon:yes stop_codon:yes gene_type:complete